MLLAFGLRRISAVGADTHELGGELPPHPLGVGPREELACRCPGSAGTPPTSSMRLRTQSRLLARGGRGSSVDAVTDRPCRARRQSNLTLLASSAAKLAEGALPTQPLVLSSSREDLARPWAGRCGCPAPRTCRAPTPSRCGHDDRASGWCASFLLGALERIDERHCTSCPPTSHSISSSWASSSELSRARAQLLVPLGQGPRACPPCCATSRCICSS